MTDPCKTMLLTGQCGVTVAASLPTSPSRDVMANIPIYQNDVAKLRVVICLSNIISE